MLGVKIETKTQKIFLYFAAENEPSTSPLGEILPMSKYQVPQPPCPQLQTFR